VGSVVHPGQIYWLLVSTSTRESGGRPGPDRSCSAENNQKTLEGAGTSSLGREMVIADTQLGCWRKVCIVSYHRLSGSSEFC